MSFFKATILKTIFNFLHIFRKFLCRDRYIDINNEIKLYILNDVDYHAVNRYSNISFLFFLVFS